MEQKVFGRLIREDILEAARGWLSRGAFLRSLTVNERTGEIQYIIWSTDHTKRVIGKTFIDSDGNAVGHGEGVRVLETLDKSQIPDRSIKERLP